ncbi:LolA-like protein [Luteipulveratus flavus]|uniref:LppX_LprAFG lipoprotein n=1 Tax=Luteipulveratus flavus TaxID=3031728 RepID=A0ABT6C6B3_9MICO|nr:hypothetical protein [Luteipulveratus sp. YIM 133296]MDF8264466.1 hypothetical protein [Luteipulveratus sp. YIM 133296]
MRAPVRRSLALVTALALSAGLTSCGSEKEQSGSGPTSSSSAPTSSTAAASSSAAPTSATSSAPAGPAPANTGAELASRVRAATDKEKSVHVEMRSAADPDVIRMDMTNKGKGEGDTSLTAGSTQLRSVGDTVYVQEPDLAGRTWLRIDDDSDSAAGVLLLPLVMVGVVTDVDSQAEIWSKGTVASKGTESVAGVQTTHYTVTVAGEHVRAAFKGATGGQAGASAAKPGDKPVTYDVWLDQRDRPARVKVDLNAIDAATGKKPSSSAGPAVATIDYTRWSAPVTIAAPPANQVKDADAVLGAGK